MPACQVPGCAHYEKARSIGVPFHQFPRNSEIRRQWLVKIRNKALSPNLSFEKVKNLRVCGKHFRPSDYLRDLQHELTGSKPKNILKKDAVPSIFPFAPETVLPERTAVTKREALRQKAERRQPSYAFGSSEQQQQHSLSPAPSASSSREVPEDYSSPFKDSTPSKSSPFKPWSGEASTGTETETTTTTTDSDSDTHSVSDTATILVTKRKLLDLFKRCLTCGEGIISKKTFSVGAKTVVLWECVRGHEGRWDSCEDIRGLPVVNLNLASGIFLSGNTFQSFQNLGELIGLQLFSKRTYHNIQNTYILPVIDKTYSSDQFNNLALLVAESLEGHGISILGDGRSDSPGFSAKYTTYSMMDEATQKIVDMQLVQVSETTSSVAMEKEGFIRSMENLLHHGIKTETVTTDRSPSIRKCMREKYGWINHQFDCWHICKGVKKKCLAGGMKKGQDILLKWTKSITNHLWYCCSACGGDAAELKRLWHSILEHVTGVHRWEDRDGTVHRCHHPELSEEEQECRVWFDRDSPAYRHLTNIVMDPRLNKDLEQLTLFKHTSGLEAYHSTMLKFAPKRIHFHYASMKGRMQLAVIDHNYNTGREQASTSEGEKVYSFVASKMQGGDWTAKRVLQGKSHGYALEMMADVVRRRHDPSVTYFDKDSQVTIPELPRNIAKRHRPPTEQLISKTVRR